MLEDVRREGVDDGLLGERLQREGAERFTASWLESSTWMGQGGEGP